MLKRRSAWLGGTGALVLVLSLSGMVAAVTPPDAQPDAVDTTATFEDVDGNAIDDDCQEVVGEADPDAVAAELLTVDVNADGIISTTEAAHSARIGGKNCNHGGYVSWIAQHKHDCVVAPTEDETTEPTGDETTEGDEDSEETVVTTPPDAEPDADAATCDESTADSAKKDHKAAAAARLAAKTERTLAREAAKAERTLAHQTSKAERQAAKAARQAERAAAKAARGNHKNH